ncbi:hypothetical protein M406DRAFT_71513 [Cryphonectria parasitica EP155]|uniref:Ecp2 effector protein domain-containing protein n=1 Tax=Cryphonectria parasitica (strain ATCC 38755 / EP155) TaxID=660469 RepID=A0A9P4Y7T8_CRYP1|nr:uncharacterized protein M406DRAFT_71513 [Cryphonectria parasitica EP155]KAF3768517.1 hypothetical protein M406DRAFT_71513 [Cryphonectria parasitica EP155]
MLLNFLHVGLFGTLASPVAAWSRPAVVVGADNTTYKMIDLGWNVRINDTHTLPVTGTVQDVLEALREVDPNYMTARIQEPMLAHDGLSDSPPARISRRSHKPTTQVCRVPGHKTATLVYIWQGIFHLDSTDGQPSNAPGPGECGRVSCSEGAAIAWCNDNKETKVLESFSDVADGAARLARDCQLFPGAGRAGGQQFFEDGWNVMVYDAWC